MKRPIRLLTVLLGPGIGLAVWIAVGCGLLWLTLDPAQKTSLRESLGPVLAANGMVLVGWWLLATGIAAWLGHGLYDRLMLAPRRLMNATRILISDAAAPALPSEGSGSLKGLAGAINGLAEERRALKAEMARQVEEASRRTAEQRDQLGALMNELDQAVVVCNLDGRVLLFNGRALALSRRVGGGAGALGLGRSVHGLVDADRIGHALDAVRLRLERGDDAAQVAAKFVTATPEGKLLQVGLAPVRHEDALTGFVLMLDDVTEQQEQQSRLDRQLLRLTETSRASIASMQAALDILDMPDLAAEEQAQFLSVVRSEVAAMGAGLAELTAASSQEAITRWPLQDMLGADLVSAAKGRIEAETGRPVALHQVDDEVWLRLDSFGMLQALAFLAVKVGVLLGGPVLWLRLTPAGARAHLDLGWEPAPGGAAGGGAGAAPEALIRLPGQAIPIGDSPVELTARVVAERHGGEIWLERGQAGAPPFFRFLLPLAPVEAASGTAAPSRPEFYDFDLFASGSTGALDDRPLSELTFTVFDTETTGLDPAGGDEIIQIGAIRIVNTRILRGETIDQLVDPQRSIPEAGIPIHHITPDMVRGQPTIDTALPAFHAFARDSVLVGHNIAFDMRFLKLKEARTGCVFDHPLLDTLLLSSIIHPGEESHGLEAIAERLGTQISGRHTALGDAVATAEVFVRLLPLLAQQGIRTLGEARSASGQSQFARLKY